MTKKHIVTGATGFVGAALVLELLQRTDDEIIAIVRPNEATAEARLIQALTAAATAYEMVPSLQPEFRRCRVLAGDLRQANCGLEVLPTGTITHFWQCAASLRYENRYQEEIHDTNVEGTRHALALAAKLGVDTFNYVSTAYVAGKASGVIAEEHSNDVALNNHYERSKVNAEQLVRASTAFRTRILRPGVVVGHSRTLAATTFSGFYGFLRQLVQFRGVMERAQGGLVEREALRLRVDEDASISLAPIDTVAEEIVRIGLSAEANGVFHITHPAPPLVSSVIRTMFRAVGLHDPIFVDNKDEFEWLDERFDRRLEFYGSYLVGNKHFERKRSDAVLGGIRGPAIHFDEATVDAFARWYLDVLSRERELLPVTR